MGKLFGLSTFINFFVLGILLGRGKLDLSVKSAAAIFSYLFVVFVLMGLFLSVDTDFLIPH